MRSTHPRGKFHLGFTIAAIVLTGSKAHETKVGDSSYRQQLRRGFTTPVAQEGKEGRALIERIQWVDTQRVAWAILHGLYAPVLMLKSKWLWEVYTGRPENSFLIQRSLDEAG